MKESNYTNTTLKMVVLLKDNKYIDRYIKGRIILNLNKEFILQLNNALHENKYNNVNIMDNNNSITLYSCLFFGECNEIIFNETLVNVTFIHKTKTIEDTFKGKSTFQYNEIYINLNVKNNNFTLNIHSIIGINKQFIIKIRHYLFILSILTIIEIYHSTNVLYQIKHSHKKSQTIIIFTIINSIITNSFLCTIHFYLSITS